AVGRFTRAGGPKGNVLRLLRQLLQDGIVNSELVRRVALAGICIRHQQGNGSALGRIRKCCQELASTLDDSIGFCGVGMELKQLRMQRGASSRVWEVRVQKSEKFRRA